jgi:hypothetical protein
MKINNQYHSDRVAFKQREKNLQSSATKSRFFIPSFLEKAPFRMTFFLLLMGSCVAPPDYSDGLLENVPAIVDETDYFSLSILGDKYTEDKEWDLSLITDSTDVLLQTLAIKELAIVSDSSFLYLIRDTGDTILAVLLLSELNWSSEDSVAYIGSPSKVIFSGNNFSGRLEYQILKK